MAVTRAQFLIQYKEFDDTDVTLVDAKLAQAERRYDVSECGDQYDDVVYARAAWLLARTPWGRTARLVNRENESVYDAIVRDLEREIGGMPRVV